MDQPTATVIAALVGAVASIAVAWLTTRGRSGVPQTSPEHSIETVPHRAEARSNDYAHTPIQAERSPYVQIARGVAWVFIGFLYLLSLFFAFGSIVTRTQALTDPYDYWPKVVVSLLFLTIAVLGHKRLRRSRV
jgi:hypothetical protein